MEIWYYDRKMKQFQDEETTEDSKYYEIVKIIEDESGSFSTDRHEIIGQNLTQKEAKDKVIELTGLLGGGGGGGD